MIGHISTAVRLERLSRLEEQRALGLAELTWFRVSLDDRDLPFRDRPVVAGSGVNAGSSHPGEPARVLSSPAFGTLRPFALRKFEVPRGPLVLSTRTRPEITAGVVWRNVGSLVVPSRSYWHKSEQRGSVRCDAP